jgi:hypothetical protein
MPKHQLHVAKVAPGVARNAKLDTYAFGNRTYRPVHAEYHGAARGWESSGLTFDDLPGMTASRRKARDLLLPVPAYVHDPKLLREVVVRFLEIRTASCKGGRRKQQPGTLAERAAAAANLLRRQNEIHVLKLEELSKRFVWLKTQPVSEENARWLKLLERQIVVLDATIRVNQQPYIVVAIVKMFYFQRVQSADVGREFGVSGAWVRQTLKRLAKLAEKDCHSVNLTGAPKGRIVWPKEQ